MRFFPSDQLEACKVMRVDQLNADKYMLVKRLRLKRKFLNYFFQDIFYPEVEFNE